MSQPRRSPRNHKPLHKEDSVHVYTVPKKQTRQEKELEDKKKSRASRPNRGLRRQNTVFEYAGHPETRETADNPFGKLVGRDVEVWFPKKKEWVKGKVVEFHAFDGLHVVEYPGDEKLFHNFGKVKYRFVGSKKTESSMTKSSDEPPKKRAKKSSKSTDDDDDDDDEDHAITPVVPFALTKQVSTGRILAGPTHAEVEEGSGLHDKGKVLVDTDGIIYDAQMTLLDISKNMDKYYRVQVVEANDGSEFWSVTHWGRTGAAGQFQVLSHGSDKEAAIKVFMSKFKEKSGINFDEREGAAPVAGKYQIKKVVYRQPGDDEQIMWQYYVDDMVDGKATGWYNYTDVAARTVEGVFSEWQHNSWLCVRCVQSGFFEYRVDFNTMTQTNLRTSKCRKIRRVIQTPNSE